LYLLLIDALASLDADDGKLAADKDHPPFPSPSTGDVFTASSIGLGHQSTLLASPPFRFSLAPLIIHPQKTLDVETLPAHVRRRWSCARTIRTFALFLFRCDDELYIGDNVVGHRTLTTLGYSISHFYHEGHATPAMAMNNLDQPMQDVPNVSKSPFIPPQNPIHESVVERLDPAFLNLYNDYIANGPPWSTDLNLVRQNYSALYSYATAPATGVGGIGETQVPGWDKYPGEISVRVYVPPGEEPGQRKVWPVHFNFHGGGESQLQAWYGGTDCFQVGPWGTSRLMPIFAIIFAPSFPAVLLMWNIA
jgi:hypothetical protein